RRLRIRTIRVRRRSWRRCVRRSTRLIWHGCAHGSEGGEGMGVRVDGRVARLKVAQICDNGGTTEQTPAPAETGRGHGELMKGVHMDKGTAIDRKTIALEYLHLAHRDMVAAAELRISRV